MKQERNREYFPLTDEVIRNHLLGQCTVGIYPLLANEIDQWQFLSTMTRISADRVETIVRETLGQGDIIGVRMSLTNEHADEDPWTLPPSRKRSDKPITEPLPARVRIVRGNLLYVEKTDLPSAMLNRLIRVAAFQNQEFYRHRRCVFRPSANRE